MESCWGVKIGHFLYRFAEELFGWGKNGNHQAPVII